MRGMMVAALAAASLAGAVSAQDRPAPVSITRLDCGSVQANDLDVFSDTRAYVGKSKQLVASCYLIRHGDQAMLWDTGVPASLKGAAVDPKAPIAATLNRTLVEQLAELGLSPDKIAIIGISHDHFDHVGQAAAFPGATLLIGKADFDARKAKPAGTDPTLAPWISGNGKVDPVSGDKDVFGDGSVVMLNLPGHTPGHHGLLVTLASGKRYLLTGDLAHFQENYDTEGVPSFNTDRADSLASLNRFKAIARNLGATVVIQHEPADIAKLPAFPQAAR